MLSQVSIASSKISAGMKKNFYKKCWQLNKNFYGVDLINKSGKIKKVVNYDLPFKDMPG